MSRLGSDALLVAALRCVAGIVGLIVVLIALFLVQESLPAIGRIGFLRFLGDPSWHPNAEAGAGRFNLAPMVLATVVATAGAVLLAAPLGVASAVFCRFYAPAPIAKAYRMLVELMAGIPSVAYGFWGLVTLAPLLRAWHPPGQSLLAATLILSMMIVPTVALLADAALRALPVTYLRGAAALGLSRWAMIRGVALPAASSGLITALVLAAGRALGETMAVLMVAGNVVQLPESLFAPVRTLTANIALELGYAAGDHRSALFVSGLFLLALTTVLMLVAERFEGEKRHG